MRRILLDHCVPKPLRKLLVGEAVRICHEEGWDTLRNGDLLAQAEAVGFEIFITADKSLRCQQNLTSRRLVIVELPTNRLAKMPLLVPALIAVIRSAVPGSYHEVPLP